MSNNITGALEPINKNDLSPKGVQLIAPGSSVSDPIQENSQTEMI